MRPGFFRKQAMSKYLRTDAPGALLTVAPPWTVAVFALMVSVCVALLGLAWFGRVQVTAVGHGVVRPDQPLSVLRAPLAGTVLSVRGNVGERGRAGDLLLELDARAEAKAHDRCTAELEAEHQELDALERRRTEWNAAAGHDRDASTALVLISQLRAQREKVASVTQRCDALGSVVTRSRVSFPVDAVVADLAVSPGSQVHEGDPLVTLVPAGARLVGYLALPERYRSDIAVGQPIRVKFDALPYNEVGMGTAHLGRVLDALPSGVKVDEPEGAGVFALIVLEAMPRGSGPARPGMTFTADVLTRKVRVLSLLFGGAT